MVTQDEYNSYVKNIANAKRAREARTEPLESMKPSPPITTNLICSPSEDEAKLNKLEKAYLSFLRSHGYQWIGIQNITIKIAHDCRLTCDFSFLDQGRLTLVDVKGFQREDAFIKIKAAARLFPWAKFQIVKRDKTGWNVKEVKP